MPICLNLQTGEDNFTYWGPWLQWSIGHRWHFSSEHSTGLSFLPLHSWFLVSRVLPPAVFSPFSLPFPLGDPSQGLACSTLCRFPQGVANPSSLLSQDLFFSWPLFPCLLKFLIPNFVWPPDPENAFQTAVDEGLHLQQRPCPYSPHLWTVENDLRL